MSADDATARWLDEQVDRALAAGGALPTELADTELGELVQLFATDAAAVAAEQLEDASGVRRRLLEQIGDEQHAAASEGFVGSIVRSTVRGTGRGAGLGARGAGWSVARAWRARRVAMVAGCVLVLCTTLAYADTTTPAGRVVRTAARQLMIPVPAEPTPASGRRADRSASDASGTQAPERDRRDEVEASVRPAGPGELGAAPDDDLLLPDGERPFDGDAPRPGGDLEPLPPREPRPPAGDAPNLGPDGTVPPPSGAPKPIGQQPPPGGIEPAPCCIQPAPQPGGIAPKPGGMAPAPGGTAPPPGAPQPAPTGPAPAPQPMP